VRDTKAAALAVQVPPFINEGEKSGAREFETCHEMVVSKLISHPNYCRGEHLSRPEHRSKSFFTG
jgi:hypothetical protein